MLGWVSQLDVHVMGMQVTRLMAISGWALGSEGAGQQKGVTLQD